MNRRRQLTTLALAVVATLAPAACAHRDAPSDASGSGAASSSAAATSASAPIMGPDGQPVYAHTRATDVQGAMKTAKPLVYVPNQMSNTVQVIDPATYKIIDTFKVGRSPEHVVPNPTGTVLWVNSDTADSMTPIDPTTGKPGTTIPISDPYNLYFSPDGKYALVMSERTHRIDVRDATTMAMVRSVAVPDCGGVNHADYSADLKTFVASCEFNGRLMVIPTDFTRVSKEIDLNSIQTPGATAPHEAHSMGGPKGGLMNGASSMPQDVRLTPDGRWLLVADMLRNGVWVIDATTFSYSRFIPTGMGAHGIYMSRDATQIYVSNRDEGSISVLDATTLQQSAKWQIPGGGSPDMGGVNADGSELWLSGRYNSEVYVFDTSSGALKARIKTAAGPHGLLVWPQPGRFSLGHTGNMR